MKVLILQNTKHFPINKRLEAVKDWYSNHIDIEFFVEKTDFKGIEYNKNGTVKRDWWRRNVWRAGYDCIVLVLAFEEYKLTGTLGYAHPRADKGTYSIVMKNRKSEYRDSRNRGWDENYQFSGTLRHELSHIFYIMTGEKDNTHYYDYEVENMLLALQDIDWGKVKGEQDIETKKEPLLSNIKNMKGNAVYPVEFDTPHNGLKWLEYYSGHNVYHPGWDLNKGYGDQDLGNSIVAPVKGTVEYISPEPTRWNRWNGGFGWFVILYHPAYGVWSRYAHCQKLKVNKIGEEVDVKQEIATVGNTGTKSAHLHWEVFGSEIFQLNTENNWRFYPKGKSKRWIAERYFDGLKWVDDINAEPGWEKKAWEWGIKNGVTNGDDPHKLVRKVDVVEMIRKYDLNK